MAFLVPKFPVWCRVVATYLALTGRFGPGLKLSGRSAVPAQPVHGSSVARQLSHTLPQPILTVLHLVSMRSHPLGTA
jgi:hypothetical protein